MHTIEITGVGSELQGAGRLPDGRAVFVPGTIPGERVDIEINCDKGRYCEASLVRVASPSPDRAAPDCPYAGECGGCQARHMTYEASLALKRRKVLDALERIGRLTAPRVLDTLGCATCNRTRNKAEYPIACQDGVVTIGAYAGGGKRVIPVNDCLLQSDISVRAMRAVRGLLNSFSSGKHLRFLVTRVNRAGELMLILCGDSPRASEIQRLSPELSKLLPELKSLWYCQLNRRPTHALDGRCTRLMGAATLKEHLFELEFEVSPQSFFQVNTPHAERLYARALEAAGIAPGCGLRVLDAYCGAGTITLCAARWAESAVGIEIVPPAIENARRSAKVNSLADRAHFICGDAAHEIPRLLRRGERFDAVIVDPPRKGCDEALLNAIAHAGIPVISYVSCNPATLARDVKLLCESGYKLNWAQPVDMFPWTASVEAVARLTRE